MKTKSIFAALTLIVLMFSFIATTPKSADPLPPFNIHISPNGSCSGNVQGAKVKIYYDGQLQGEQLTDGTGFAYFTVPVGKTVDAIATYGTHTGNLCGTVQIESGYYNLEVCLNDLSCSIEKHKRILFGCEQIWYN